MKSKTVVRTVQSKFGLLLTQIKSESDADFEARVEEAKTCSIADFVSDFSDTNEGSNCLDDFVFQQIGGVEVIDDPIEAKEESPTSSETVFEDDEDEEDEKELESEDESNPT